MYANYDISSEWFDAFQNKANIFFPLCQRYRYHLGVELLSQSDEAGEALLKMLWHHQDAILCCSFKVWYGLSLALLHTFLAFITYFQ